MLYVCTLFNKARDSHPLITGVYDSSADSWDVYPLYLPGTGKTLWTVDKNIAKIRDIILDSKSVALNDYKQHIVAFNIGKQHDRHNVYDVDAPCRISKNVGFKECCKNIIKIVKQMRGVKLSYWHVVRANAAVPYAYLQRRGVRHNYSIKHPIYGWVFSGRSKTSGFNIQGLSENERISACNSDRLFVQFDWVAADMRVIALMSKDQKLSDSFICSDPYQYFIDHANVGWEKEKQLKRSEGKDAVLSSVYSLRVGADDPAMLFYDGLAKWIIEQTSKLSTRKYLRSVLGRKFGVPKDRTAKSAFNAMVQGSVAHAMQICFRKVWDTYPDSILTENHDSLVVTSSEADLKAKIVDIASIMVQPFKGILSNNPQFPVRVSVGLEYRKWRTYKRFNSYEQVTKKAQTRTKAESSEIRKAQKKNFFKT